MRIVFAGTPEFAVSSLRPAARPPPGGAGQNPPANPPPRGP
ncbi:methionyl-tRNA formyltransferase, partial [Stenotrophomonas sp. Sm2017]|nr:methionyl-tRNA formyltransferase [Stenotrophomonas sp. Sm2017]